MTAPDLARAAGEVPVTPHFIPLERKTAEKNQQSGRTFPRLVEPSAPVHSAAAFESDYTQSATFCDWLSIYQRHGGDLPRFSDGCFMRFDADGSHSSTSLKKLKLEGSHESAVFIRCDGDTVWFEGNVSKFGRPDNVFGYTFAQCLLRVNALLERHGLPPFTPGLRLEVNTPNGWRPHWSGARISRLDLTENFSTGSKENAYHFMRFLQGQQSSRLKTGTYGEGETVDFGRHSRRVYSKAYLKGPELLKHARKIKAGDKSQTATPFDPYLYELADWCNSIGLVRFETTYKSTYLIDNYLQFLGSIDMQQLEIDFKERQSVFTRAVCDVEDLAELEPKALAVYRMWQAGDDLTSKFKKSQFYKYRSALLPFGVDIAIKSNVVKFEAKTKIIKLDSCKMPEFYKLPPPLHIRLAA